MSAQAEYQLVAAMVAGRPMDDAYKVKPEDFASEQAAAIWEAGRSLLEENRPVTAIAIHEAMRKAGKSEYFANVADVADYDSAFIERTDIAEAAKVLVENRRRRQARAIASSILEGLKSTRSTDAVLGEGFDRIQSLLSSDDDDGLIRLSEAMYKCVEQIRNRMEGNDPRCSTGFSALDGVVRGGLAGGWQVVVGARPKMGKSALALQLAYEVSRKGGPVLFFSHEMSASEIGGRALASMARVGLTDIQAGPNQEYQWRKMAAATNDVRNHKFFITDRPMDMDRMRAIARGWRRANPDGVGMIVVDYLQLVEVERQKGVNREQEVAGLSRRLKNLARETGCVSLVLSQLNRNVESREDKRPRVSDLRESGAIEQDADLILLLYRPWVYDTTKSPADAQIIVGANRHGPMPVVVPCKFSPEQTRFDA